MGGTIRQTSLVLLIALTVLAAGAVVLTRTASAESNSSLSSFLLAPGGIKGFESGKIQIFRSVDSVRKGSGERLSEKEARRYEAEGFVEGAQVRIRDRTERGTTGISRAFQFEASAGAESEMKSEFREAIDSQNLRDRGISIYFHLRRFKVAGVPRSEVFSLVTNKLAEKAGVESGIAEGMFVEGECLISLGVFSFKSNNVTDQVVSGIQNVFDQTAGACPPAD